MILLTITDDPKDRTKFCILYEKYRYLLHKVAMEVLHDRYLAEDAVQSAFIKIADNIAKVGEIDSRQTKSYLIVIAKNAAIDISRKRKRQMKREINADEIGEEKLPAVCMESDLENGVLDILKNLPEKYRDVFSPVWGNTPSAPPSPLRLSSPFPLPPQKVRRIPPSPP